MQDRSPVAGSIVRIVTVPLDDREAEHVIGLVVADAEARGYELRGVATLGPSRVALTLTEPPMGWRPSVPGETGYEHAEALGHDGAAFLSYLVSAHLPKEEPVAPVDVDDPDYEPDEIGPHDADLSALDATRESPEDPDDFADDEPPGVVAAPQAMDEPDE